MSDRFYTQMREATGWCPGLPESYKFKQRRRKVAWTDEAKAQAVKMVADELGESPNGVRMILTKAGVYVKKTPAVRASSGNGGGGRVSIADAQQSLKDAISDAGAEADEAIIGKLTGKAAKYFAELIEQINK